MVFVLRIDYLYLMWGWFRKTPKASSREVEGLAKQWFGPQALAIAIADSVHAYVDDVKAGRLSYPAHRRKGSSVVEIWRDLRLEALHNLFNFGQSAPFLLSEYQRQLELLVCFLDERPHLEIPQQRGEVIPDTIQAIWQVYLYLDKVGSEVADRETDRAALKLAGRSILDSFTMKSQILRDGWDSFEQAIRSNGEQYLPQMPQTLIEVLYEDVTAKAKSAALSTVFGPSYEGGIEYIVKLVAEKGGTTADVKASIDRVLDAKDPDEFSTANQ